MWTLEKMFKSSGQDIPEFWMEQIDILEQLRN